METIIRFNRMVPGYILLSQLHERVLAGEPADGCPMDWQAERSDSAHRSIHLSIHLMAWHPENE
jgi:hypothetical protein